MLKSLTRQIETTVIKQARTKEQTKEEEQNSSLGTASNKITITRGASTSLRLTKPRP